MGSDPIVPLPRDPELDLILFEDLLYIEELCSEQNIKPRDIRHASNIMRRLLMDGDLKKVAASRGLRIEIPSPDIRHVVKQCEQGAIVHFQASTCSLFGISVAMMMVSHGSVPPPVPSGWSPDDRVFLKIDNFLNQKVIFLNGNFAERKRILRYAANKGGGVHFDRDREALIDRIRGCVRISLEEGTPSIAINDIPGPFGEMGMNNKAIDSIFLEVYSMISLLLESETISALRESIRDEYG